MKSFDSKKAFEYMTALTFERRSGSLEELKAAKLIAGYLRKMGLRPHKEKFSINAFSIGDASLKVTSPFKKKYQSWPVGYSKSTPAGGVSGELTYIDSPTPAKLSRLSGKIVILFGGLKASGYKALNASGAKGYIRINPPDRHVFSKMGHEVGRKYGRMPGVFIGYNDGLEILKRGAKRARFTSKASVHKGASQNVIAEVCGTDEPKEIIIVCGHYDSVPWSPGATDNAAGSALTLALAGMFARTPPRRTLRFVWFGCEEIGLVGAFEYVKKHAAQMKNIKLVVNLDVGGSLIGRVRATVTGGEKLANYVEALGKEIGVLSDVSANISSSDSVPFAEHGIQALNLWRGGGGSYFGHTEGDTIKHCAPRAFDAIGAMAVEFIKRLANSIEFPFKRSMPANIRKKLKDYITERSGRKYNYRGETDGE